jgi:Cu/Ag efflux protein CusF
MAALLPEPILKRKLTWRKSAMKTTWNRVLGRAAAAAALVVLSAAAFAQTASTEGEIKKVDAAAGRVVIKHGDWPEMNMHAMTMGFGVKDRAILDGVKAADKVRFTIEKTGRDWLVTKIDPASATGNR